MGFMKRSLCSLIVFSSLFASLAITPKTNQVYATENGNDVFLNVGEKYYYKDSTGNYNITDSADGNSISQEEVHELNISMFNHVSNTANSLNSFSTTANTSISLDDAMFKFTNVDVENNYYTIFNEKTNQYLTHQSGANGYFSSSPFNMIVREENNHIKICKTDGKRYIMFYVTNMDFNGNSDNGNTNTNTFKFELTLLQKNNTLSPDDVIPGYTKVTSVESGKSYLITVVYNGSIFVLYPTNGTGDQTKLVKFNKYNDLYAIGSSTVSSDTLAQNHLTLTQTNSGISMQSNNGNYMCNSSGNPLLTSQENFFVFENGKEAGKYRVKTTGGRYYVYNTSGPKMDAMSAYDASRDGTDLDYDFMLFEKTETVNFDSLIPGYAQVTNLDSISSDKQYILVYIKEQNLGNSIYVVNVSGSISNTNNLRKVVSGTKRVQFTALDFGKETVTINGNTLNFYVVANLASNKVVTAHWSSDDSACNVSSGHYAAKATDGTINTDNYIDFGVDNNTNGSYVQLDLGQTSLIKKINLYRYWKDGRTYRNTVIAVSNDPQFHNYKIIHNTDTGNIHGLGAGTGATYAESSAGKSFVFDETTARYVRVYMNGQSDSKTTNHIVELQVFGYEVTPEEIVTDSVVNTKNDTYAGNYLFEGYYSDETCETVKTKDEYLANDEYVAKYVNPNVLTVKGQTKREADGTYTIRFVSSVASLNLEEVGFEISKNNGNAKTISTTKVYNQIIETISNTPLFTNPSQVFNNTESQHFFVAKVKGIKELNANDTITITPFWIPHGSDKKVKGTTRTETLKTFMDAAPSIIQE